MRNLLIISAFCLLAITTATGQVIIDTAYFKNIYIQDKVSAKQAKIIQYTIQEPDGSLCYKMTDKKSNKVLRQRCYKGDTPCGIWITEYGEEFDYTGKFTYNDTAYTDIPNYKLEQGKLQCTTPGNFEPPIFPLSDHIFDRFVSERLIYPQIATENGIQGELIAQYIIDETGKLTDLRIIKSAAKILDVEAVRIILQSPLWIPAKQNGKPVKSCITMPLKFVLVG